MRTEVQTSMIPTTAPYDITIVLYYAHSKADDTAEYRDSFVEVMNEIEE